MSLLDVTPDELCFPPPFDKVIACILRLRNTSATDVAAFKVKTTAPRRYCVRPNSGYVNPGEEMEIQILLQPLSAPPEDVRSKDKFLVQSMRVPPGQRRDEDISTVWPTSKDPQVLKDIIGETKLRCYFQSPEARAAQRSQAQAEANSQAPRSPADHSGPAPVTARGDRPAMPNPNPNPNPNTNTNTNTSSNASSPPQQGSQGSQNQGSQNQDRRLQEAERALVAASKDRDQLHDTLEEAASKLEQVLSEKQQALGKIAELEARIRAMGKGPQSAGGQGTGSSDGNGSSGFGLSFVLMMCLAFLFVGATLGASYGNEISLLIAGKADSATGGDIGGKGGEL